MQWLVSIAVKFLGGPFITGALNAYKAKLDSENKTESKVTDLAAKALELDVREAQINSNVVIAEQGNWFTRSVRPLWAIPFVIWTWKAVLIDKVVCPPLGYDCSTDALQGMVATLCVTISVAYFGGRSAEKVATIIAGARKGLTGKGA